MSREESQEDLSRRAFLKSAAFGAAGIASFGVADLAFADDATGAATEAAVRLGDTLALDDVTLEDGSTTTPIAPVDPPAQWDQEYDVVVVGAGAGGLNAAAYAAAYGLSVLCIDKVPVPGGGSMHATVWGCMSGGTKIQDAEQYALPSWPFDPDKALAFWMPMYKWANPELIRQLIVKGPEAIEWMADMGIPWQTDPQFHSSCLEYQGAVEDGFYPLGAKLLTDHMYNVGVDAGAEYSFSTPCAALVKDGDRVVGVKITDIYGNNEKYVHATKGVILTAGGFAVNRAMLKKYVPQAFMGAASAYAMPGDTGECTRMGIGAGADMTGLGSWQVFDGGIADYDQGLGPFHHYLYSGDVQIARQPWLGIDIRGKKYPYVTSRPGSPTEVMGIYLQADNQMSQIGHRSYVIFDGNFETYLAKSPERACRYPLYPEMRGIERLPEYLAPHDWHVGFNRALERGSIKKADTLDELASQLGFEAGVIPRAVEEWNAHVVATDLPDGTEDQFGYPAEMLNPIDTPPYYGIKIGGMIFTTLAGLLVTPQMQVMDTRGQVIPGLYAGFHTAGGAIGDQAGGSLPTCQCSLGLSFTGGYIAAQTIVNEEA